jgi:hypothetical protein
MLDATVALCDCLPARISLSQPGGPCPPPAYRDRAVMPQLLNYLTANATGTTTRPQ